MSYNATELLEHYKEKVAEEVKTKSQRKRLTNSLTEEGQAAHKTGRYDISFDKFVHLLAVIELDRARRARERLILHACTRVVAQ